MSRASQRSPIAATSLAMVPGPIRSSGAMVAFPPASWMRPSTSSSASAVRATSTTWAPAAARASAVAAPMPRLAPVTSASLPARGFESVMEGPLAAGDEGKRAAVLAGGVGERRRIVAGEAGIAALRARRFARIAERPIEPVDRDEGEAVGVDEVAHRVDIHLRGEQLGALGRVD